MRSDFSDPGAGAPSADFVELLQARALHPSQPPAFRFTRWPGPQTDGWTYAELDGRARAVAARLRSHDLGGQRVLLLCPPGLDYIGAFFGCLYAGAVAVPVYPPRRNRSLRRIEVIAAEAEARGVLTTQSILEALGAGPLELPHLAELDWLLADDLPLSHQGLEVTRSAADDIALLQFTSGSTAAPKGVMVSHGNLMRNSELIKSAFGTHPQSRGVSWLPLYHDMGLIGGILQALYAGAPLSLMAPVSFLQQPFRWLEMISRERATISGGPNFAYDQCARSVTPEQLETLDLSCWEVAFCGSEPIRPEALDRFAEVFAPAGFRRDAFHPCFGLAEATLMVSARRPGLPLAVEDFDGAALETNVISHPVGASKRRLVGAGAVSVERVEIVDPDTHHRRPSHEVGEIWVRDPSVAKGYWNRAEETEHTFNARLADGGGPFMRTGDLGFLHGGQLFVTGRLKELIILRGRNYYPQDLEAVAAASHPAIEQGANVAFSIEENGAEKLVLVAELARSYRQPPTEEIAAAVRQAIAAEFEVEVEAVVLTPPLGVPKTSSGKLERRECRRAYLAAELRVAGVSRRGERAAPRAPAVAAATPPSAAAIRAWTVERIAELIETPTSEIDVDAPFTVFGLDSVKAVELSGELEIWLGRTLPATLVWDYPTIDALAQHLAEGEAKAERSWASAVVAVRAAPTPRAPADLDSLSKSDLRALLSKKVTAIELGSIR